MSYRSDVVIGLTKEAYMEGMLKKNLPVLLQGLKAVNLEGETVFYFFATSWQWYDSYDNVGEVMAWLNTLEPDNTGAYTYGFLRIGKDLDDTKSLGAPYRFNMYINRELIVPVGVEKASYV